MCVYLSLRSVVLYMLALTWAAESDDYLAALATETSRLHRITETPHEMADSSASLCMLISNRPHNPHEGDLLPRYCHVYVNAVGRKTMLRGEGEFPIDSLIVKSKLFKKDEKKVELFTVMRKRAEGYDPDHGDWEYSVIDGRSRRVLAVGKIDSCINCHSEYKDSDFITREYLKPGEQSDEHEVAEP